jgi:hypothetical protein
MMKSSGIFTTALAVVALCSGFPRQGSASSDVIFLRNDSETIHLRYRTPTASIQEIQTDGQSYKVLGVPGTAVSWAEGMPQLPTRVIWLVIPPGSTPILDFAVPYTSASVAGVPAPVPTPVPSSDGMANSVFIEDPAFYAGSTLFPAAWVEMQDPDFYRDRWVVRVLVHPFRFAPSEREILRLDSVDVRLSLRGGTKAESGGTRPAEDRFFQGLISNWGGAAKGWKLPKLPAMDLSDPWPAGDLYKIEINESGIYKLTYQDLVNAGINLNGLDPATIRLFNNGGEVLPKDLITPRPQGPIENALLFKNNNGGANSFDPGDELWFYGKSVHEWNYNSVKHRYQHYRNPYTDRNVYWLNINPSGPAGKRMANLGIAGIATVNPGTTRNYYYDEKEIYAVYDSYNLPQSMPDLYGELFSGPGSKRSFSFYLTGVTTSAPALLYLKLRFGDTSVHSFDVYLNNNSTPLFSTTSTSLERTLDAGVLQTGINTLQLVHNSNGTAYIDYFEIEYTRDLATPYNGEIEFISPAVSGLANYQIGASGGWQPDWIFDVTDFAEVKCTDQPSFKDSVDADVPRRYLALSESAILKPYSITKDRRDADEYVNLRSTLGADILLICADQFYDAAAAYEEYREQQAPTTMQVIRVKVSDIFDEYGWGLVDPAAIRDFLKSTMPLYNWAISPVYVLFIGDGDFDYKNRLADNDANWVIPFEEGSRCTDDWYSYFSPTDNSYSYPQVASGRWPVRSADELLTLVERLIAYENSTEYGPWQDRVTFVADDEYGPGGVPSAGETLHTIDTENLAENYTPRFLNLKKIYLTEYPVVWDPAGGGRRKPAANSDLINAVNEGCLLVNYMGHGNPSVWAHEHVLLQSRDMPLFANGDKLPLFIAATCDWAYWDSPTEQSMPEAMITLPGGGAIAAIAATRVTSSNSNNQLSLNLYEEMFSEPGGTPLGLALMRAKSQFFLKNRGQTNLNTNSEKYHLLGDPVMSLAVPKLKVHLDADVPDTLYALDPVTLTGEIQTESGTFLPDFQGVAHLQVFDSRVPIYYGFNNAPPPSTPTYYLPGSLIFRGDVSVENGRFQSTFIVPVDINYGGAGGRFSVFAYSQNSTGAGVNDSVYFGAAAATLQDSIPPAVKVYFDSPGFRSGDPIRSDATLYIEVADSNGVNLTGSVGHGIMATVDDSNPIDLTDAFTYYLNSYTTGRAEYKFTPGEIPPGRHTLNAIAWDAANNPNTASLDFEVVGTDRLKISDVLNYPNPFSKNTRFTFTLTEEAEVTIKIYTVAGRLIKVISDIPGVPSFNYDHPLLNWDGRDEQGDVISNGVYIYKIIARGFNGNRDEATGKLMVIR